MLVHVQSATSRKFPITLFTPIAANIFKAGFVMVNMFLTILAAVFDTFCEEALGDIPDQSSALSIQGVSLEKFHAFEVGRGIGIGQEFNFNLTFGHFDFGPDFTRWNMVECGDDIGHARGLLNIAYGNPCKYGLYPV